MQIIRKEMCLEVSKITDVLVVGGGPAGIGAAVSAVRQGNKVILLEKRGFLGGNITACYVENGNHFLKETTFQSRGLYAEIEEKCFAAYGNDNTRLKNIRCFHSEYLKVFLDDFLEEEGVEVLFHAFVNEVIVENNRIEAVLVQTKKGVMAIKGKVVIDATGDGDVAYSAGVEFEQGRKTDGLCQPGTVSLRLAGANVEDMNKKLDALTEIGETFREAYCEGKTGLTCKRQDIPFGRLTHAGLISYVNYACVYGLDPTDIEDLSKGEREGRRYAIDIYQYLKSHYDELKGIEIASIAPEIGFRDSRRIKGMYELTLEDMEKGKKFDDVIVEFPRFYDMLAPDGDMKGDGDLQGKGYKGHIYCPIKDDRVIQIPYRSLLPVTIDNLLTAGRCICADHVAESGIRAILACMMTGEAAGAAAALAIQNRIFVRNIDIKELQKKIGIEANS